MASVLNRDARLARARKVRRFVGGFYLTMGGINAGIVFADPQTYQHFADGAYLGFVTEQWQAIVMADPALWGLLLAFGEICLGTLLLQGGRAVRIGWVGVLSFHVLLMLFGPGIWLWCIPVLVVLVPACRADWPQLGDVRPSGVPHVQPAG
jgi:hypothetical protein